MKEWSLQRKPEQLDQMLQMLVTRSCSFVRRLSVSGLPNDVVFSFIANRNGDTYAGEYFANKIHGFGVYCFATGCLYEGAWHEGRRQGLGMCTFRNGETQSGHWQNSVLDASSTQNTHAGFPVTVNHSKVLDAVQEARRAAEKAFDVARVDERVENAVAAANKAANKARVAALIAVQKRTDNNNEDDIPIPIV